MEMPWEAVLGGVAVGLTVWWIVTTIETFRTVRDLRGKTLPGPKNAWHSWPLGFVKSIRHYRQNSTWYLKTRELIQEYGPIMAFRTHIGASVVVADPEIARIVLCGTAEDFPKGPLYKKLGVIGDGILSSNGPTWRRDRRMLQDTFQQSSCKRMDHIFNRHALELVEAIRDAVGREGGEAEFTDSMMRLTFDVISHAGFGHYCSTKTSKGDNKPQEAIVVAIRDLIKEALTRTLDFNPLSKYLPWRYFPSQSGARVLSKLIDQVKRERDHEEGEKRDISLIDLMIRANKDDLWTPNEFLSQCMTFMLAGHETTSAHLSWTIFELGRHPEVLQKLREEVVSVVGNDEWVNPDDVENRLPYLRAVIMESLRLHPPVSTHSRTLARATEVGGYLLPAGYTVGVNIFSIHRSPKYWPDADSYIPDRWLGKGPDMKSQFQFVPFSYGVRGCLGQKFALMESSIALAQIVRHLDFSLSRPDLKMKEPPAMEMLTVRPKEVWCHVTPLIMDHTELRRPPMSQ